MWLENYRDLLWQSFDLEVYLVEAQHEYLNDVVESSLAKIESILSSLSVASHQRVSLFQMSIFVF